MEFDKTLFSRRSTRAFTDRPVTRGEIDTMLRAATAAPSACNMQSWHFYVVTDPVVREKLGGSGAFNPWAAKAPVVFIICTDGEAIVNRFGEKAEKLFIIQDTSAATENLLLCATDLGLGGCWMGMFDEAKCREIVGISTKHRVVAVVPVGEPASVTPPRERKPLGEVVTYIGDAINESDNTPSKSDGKPFVLRGTSLPDSVFNNLNLSGAQFDDVNMEGASFNNINMHRVRFTDINLSDSSFGGLTLKGSRFGCVDIDGATFENPTFVGTTFRNCSFKDAKFEGCDFENAGFSDCKNK